MTPWTAAHQAPLSMRFSRQGYCNGLPFPSPGDLCNPRIGPRSPALQADSLPTELQGKPSSAIHQCCCCQVASVVSDSVRPHRWQPTRLPRPWDSPSKNSGVGCRFLLQCMKVKSESEVAQSLSDPIDCSLPGSSIHGILNARIL